ncbi:MULTISPECIES: hypothetical protein [unclassified Blastococcus]|uniref:hypothetical protein n=1 Tax=unclassified Blastococcus TaxID=2619396 RepID=UPI001EF11411|nr:MULTISPECIES: hypothetical protein [unclassified Blastococcus]
MVAFARSRSPYYRQRYAGLPDPIEDPSLLPVTGKRDLMVRFDEAVTDRRVTRAAVEAFVADPTLVGRPFLDGYTVTTTSGTTGVRGLFIIDQWALAVATAMGGRMRSSWLLAARQQRLGDPRAGRLPIPVRPARSTVKRPRFRAALIRAAPAG